MSSLHVTNARIWTGDHARPYASSMTIRDGLVESLDIAPGDEPLLDCGGDFITPGFIDSHVHLLLGGESLSQVDLSTVTSREEFEQALAAAHEALPEDRWLIANGWSDANLGTTPDMDWLKCVHDRPTACWRSDLHAALVNGPILSKLDLPSPGELAAAGGDAPLRDDGTPTGMLLEHAAWGYLVPAIPPLPVEARQEALLLAQEHCLRLGLTSVRSMEYGEVLREVIEPVRDELDLRISIVLLDRTLPLDLAWLEGFRQDAYLQVIGCKSFLDGTVGSRTARMLEDWTDSPGSRGMWLELAAEKRLEEWQQVVHEAGLDTAVHAIGDEAVSLALDLHEQSHGERRCVIEHAQVVRDEDLPRTAGALLSMQPLHRADDARVALRALGPDRDRRMLRLRDLQDAGARFAFGSDWPVASCDPMPGIHAAVTAEDSDGTPFHPGQALDIESTLHGWTTGAALACNRRDIGMLRPQARGDFVRWSTDLLLHDWKSGLPHALMTVLGGKVVYDGSDDA